MNSNALIYYNNMQLISHFNNHNLIYQDHLDNNSYIKEPTLKKNCDQCGISNDELKKTGREKLKRCGGCYEIRYCSKECQILARKTHMLTCGPLKPVEFYRKDVFNGELILIGSIQDCEEEEKNDKKLPFISFNDLYCNKTFKLIPFYVIQEKKVFIIIKIQIKGKYIMCRSIWLSQH